MFVRCGASPADLCLLLGILVWIVGPAGPAEATPWYGDSPRFSLNTISIVAVSTPEPFTAWGLLPNYPNPFNPNTTIVFRLAAPEAVRLDIYDLLGRRVKILLDGKQLSAGEHSVVWDGRDGVGRLVAGGVYFCQVRAGALSAIRRMTLVK